jgi:galactosylceramidase
MVEKTGNWKLLYDQNILKEGEIADFDGNSWHELKLKFQNTEIEAFVDGMPLARISHQQHSGYVSLASSYHGNLFDNMEIKP